jgi:hypothetical protein
MKRSWNGVYPRQPPLPALVTLFLCFFYTASWFLPFRKYFLLFISSLFYFLLSPSFTDSFINSVYFSLVVSYQRTDVENSSVQVKEKGKAIPVTSHEGPQGCETSRLQHFLHSRLPDGGEVSLTCRHPLPPGRFLVLISVRGWVDPRASAAGRIRSIEKSNDLIGNRTRDLPACSVVPQPSTLPRAPALYSAQTNWARSGIAITLALILRIGSEYK